MFFCRKVCLFLFAVVCLSFSRLASADYYAGVLGAYSSSEYTHSSVNFASDGHPLLLQAEFGYYFDDYLALEGRYGVSAQRSSGLYIDRLASLLVKGNLPVSEQIAIYALAGVSSAKLDQQNIGSSSESGASFGLGAHYAFDQHRAVTFEYLSSLNEDSAKISGLSVAFQYRF